jgi:hypothetical protein
MEMENAQVGMVVVEVRKGSVRTSESKSEIPKRSFCVG